MSRRGIHTTMVLMGADLIFQKACEYGTYQHPPPPAPAPDHAKFGFGVGVSICLENLIFVCKNRLDSLTSLSLLK